VSEMNPEFDEAYYNHYYHDEDTRVFARECTPRFAKFAFSYLDLMQIPIKSACDLGCGLGYWRNYLRARPEKISYTGVDKSEYACSRFGWINSTVEEYRPGRRFDLVICQSVLQYLGDDAINSAAENIAEITRKAFLLEVPTEWDFENTLSSRSDSNVHKRSKQFYLALFAPWFENYGGGLFIKKDFAFYPYDIWRF